jgi:hypothetical protein
MSGFAWVFIGAYIEEGFSLVDWSSVLIGKGVRRIS